MAKLHPHLLCPSSAVVPANTKLDSTRERKRKRESVDASWDSGKQQCGEVRRKGAISPLVSSQYGVAEVSPETADLIHKTTMVSPLTPTCTPLGPERVKPRRLFDSDGKREAINGAANGHIKPARSSPKKAKGKAVQSEDTRIDGFSGKRKSPRLAELSERKKSRGSTKKKKGNLKRAPKAALDVEFRKVLQKAVRNPTCRDGKSLRDGQVRRFVKSAIFEGVEYRVGDDVYVRRGTNDEAHNDEYGALELASDSDEEVEECVLCGETGKEVMIECDECLGGYHLGCLVPRLEEVPEGDWSCTICEALSRGEDVLRPAHEKRRRRTARERFLAEEIWAARIEKLWRDKDGTLFFQGRWWATPGETAEGRQPWHGRRELFRSNMVDENEMVTVLRHCYVMTPEEYANSGHEGDDVFMSGHEYDFRHQTFKRIADEFDDVSERDDSDDESFDPAHKAHGQDGEDHEDDEDDENDDVEKDEVDVRGKPRKKRKFNSTGNKISAAAGRAANLRRGHVDHIEGVGAKQIPHARKRPLTDLENAKAALGLSAAPASLPCRDREKCEIETFVKEAVAAGEDCLGRCLYISGVPGTGKTATVLEVMKGLRAKVDNGELPPYRFVEINGLRLTSPEHAYTVLHEALTGQHCGWRRALQFLDARFSDTKPLKGVHARPCILLVDELDLLVTRNQSVLYNLFDWPSRANSRLIVIGIANTMDLPERMLPRIASRLGLHRISFGPYSHTQLQQILATRLEGIPAFDKQAVEFASRKVAAVSGDARRALELCRRAAEITELRRQLPPICPTSTNLSQIAAAPPPTVPALQATSKLIGMADIEAAITEMFQAPHIQFMKRYGKYAKIFLVAMVIEQHRTTMVETTFEKVVMAFMRLCDTHKEHCPGVDSLLTIGCKLGASRLLLCEPGIRHRHQKLQLNFPSDDVSFALKDDEELPWLAKYL